MLKPILQDAMARSLAHYQADPERWQGWDWWELSPEESEVLSLSPARWAELLPVWQAFEFFIGRTDGWNDEEMERDYPDLGTVMQAVRDQYPEWVCLNAPAQTFMRFAQCFAAVRFREAHAMFTKMQYWGVRAGIHWFSDEMN